MAFLFAYDRRNPRDEDMTLSRAPSQRHAPHSTISPPDGTQTPLDGRVAESNSHSPSPSPAPKRKHVVLPDPVAFRFLVEDPAVSVVEPRRSLPGYELYLVEQWACSRLEPTLVLATYTGNTSNSIVVGILAVPADEVSWSPRLRWFFKAVQKYHARPKETPLGELMVTNLSSFPSAFTVIPVPNGDIRTHQKIFMVNENLKRLGCSGRSGLTLSEPSSATQSKFYLLYKISDRIPLNEGVLELMKLCQIALFIFGHLDDLYIDGLLCDQTETAIGNWWTEVGAEYYNIEPSDGILGPTTVAALLGMLMGARNRLHSYGAPVSKEVFDIEATRRGIAYFQKYQKLERTRLLDRQTLLKLQSATAKAAAGEGWGVQRAVKSTVAEIGGKRGEIVLGMVSGRDKGGIGEIETLDIDRFISLVSGERAKWLWHGKPKRITEHDRNTDLAAPSFGGEESRTQAARRAVAPSAEDDTESRRRDEMTAVYASPPPPSSVSMTDSPGDRDSQRKGVFRSVADKMSDARSGLGRFKGAVGGSRKGHVSRPSKDEMFLDSAIYAPLTAGTTTSSAALSSPPPVARVFTWKNKPEEYLNGMPRDQEAAEPQSLPDDRANGSSAQPQENGQAKRSPSSTQLSGPTPEAFGSIAEEIRRDVVEPASVAASVVGDQDLTGPLLQEERDSGVRQSAVFRRHSIEVSSMAYRPRLNENRWPRRMSFGDAEEAIFQPDDEVLDLCGVTEQPQQYLEEFARLLYQRLTVLTDEIKPWVSRKIDSVEALDRQYARDQEEMGALAYQLTEAYEQVKATSEDLLAGERGSLSENLKEVDALLARLEYEINGLISKMDDVEEGVMLFERHVRTIERRAEELKVQLETESWLHWLVRTLTGVGTGPNLTRPRKDDPKT